LVSLSLAIECEINKVSHVFNMDLDEIIPPLVSQIMINNIIIPGLVRNLIASFLIAYRVFFYKI
jgi:hypothetical protein